MLVNQARIPFLNLCKANLWFLEEVSKERTKDIF